MKNTVITELVKFKVLETVTDEQLIAEAAILNDFLGKQDGFLDGEIVKHVSENEWHLIYHFENMEKVKAIGDKMRSNKVFDRFMPHTLPGSVSVVFYNQIKKVS